MDSPDSENLIYDWNKQGFSPGMARKITFGDQTLGEGLKSSKISSPSLEEKKSLLSFMDHLGLESLQVVASDGDERLQQDGLALLEEIAQNNLGLTPHWFSRLSQTPWEKLAPFAKKITLHLALGPEEMTQSPSPSLIEKIRKEIEVGIQRGFSVILTLPQVMETLPATLQPICLEGLNSGAVGILLQDTTGQATPIGVQNLVRFVFQLTQGLPPQRTIQWQGRQDRGLAMANSIAAYLAGADLIWGAFLGLGSGCGLTPMETLLVNFHLMKGLDKNFSLLKEGVDQVAKVFDIPLPHNYPVFGSDAFETATGVHAAAVIKAFRKGDSWLANQVYSGVPADVFGLEQKIRVGPMSGKSNVIFWLKNHEMEPKEEVVDKIFQAAKSSNRLLTDQEILSLISEGS